MNFYMCYQSCYQSKDMKYVSLNCKINLRNCGANLGLHDGFNALDVFLCCVVLFRADAEGIMKEILGFTKDDVVSTDLVADCK